MFQSSRGNLSICGIERQAKALALGFQSSPALRNGIRNRQNTTRKPLSDFHLKPLLQFLAPLAYVKQLAPLANFPKRNDAYENRILRYGIDPLNNSRLCLIRQKPGTD